ncbi:MAG TPA: biotin/lipoyl-containing protein, partial [bacterium]|nr:biotin/lipoyl-containing protein [bacterium]
KPLVSPPLQDEIMGAMVTEVSIAAGDRVARGQAVLTVMDGEEIREITASRAGVVSEVIATPGSFLEGGAVIAETRPRAWAVVGSIWSAFLGTMAFSALTMGYLIRKTNVPEWVLLAGATLLLYWPTPITDFAGLALVALVWWSQRGRNRRDEAAAAPASA